nr:hypothetical protein 7 [bacterium]
MELNELTPKKKRFVEALVNDETGDIQKIISSARISEKAFNLWIKNPVLITIAIEESVKRTGAKIPLILKNLSDKAQKGDTRDVKIFFELYNRLNADSQTEEIIDPDELIDDVKRELQEEE